MMAYKRKPSLYYELSGPVFDPRNWVALNRAIGEGIQSLADEGVEILQSFIHQAGLIDSGRLVSSVHSEYTQTRGAGFAKVLPAQGAVWPKKDRPTRIWLERGTRGGTRLRSGKRPFSKTKTRLREIAYQRHFADRITRALN